MTDQLLAWKQILSNRREEDSFCDRNTHGTTERKLMKIR